MKSQYRALLRAQVETHGLHKIADNIGVSDLTLAKVIGPLPVNRAALEMIERAAETIEKEMAESEEP